MNMKIPCNLIIQKQDISYYINCIHRNASDIEYGVHKAVPNDFLENFNWDNQNSNILLQQI